MAPQSGEQVLHSPGSHTRSPHVAPPVPPVLWPAAPLVPPPEVPPVVALPPAPPVAPLPPAPPVAPLPPAPPVVPPPSAGLTQRSDKQTSPVSHLVAALAARHGPRSVPGSALLKIVESLPEHASAKPMPADEARMLRVRALIRKESILKRMREPPEFPAPHHRPSIRPSNPCARLPLRSKTHDVATCCRQPGWLRHAMPHNLAPLREWVSM